MLKHAIPPDKNLLLLLLHKSDVVRKSSFKITRPKKDLAIQSEKRPDGVFLKFKVCCNAGRKIDFVRHLFLTEMVIFLLKFGQISLTRVARFVQEFHKMQVILTHLYPTRQKTLKDSDKVK